MQENMWRACPTLHPHGWNQLNNIDSGLSTSEEGGHLNYRLIDINIIHNVVH